MHLTDKDITDLTASSMRAFLEKSITERHHLDYKVALSGRNQEDQSSEFLKDVTGFANANGGDIILGVKEPKEGLSVDDQIVGIPNGENVAHSLERLAMSGAIDPRITGLKVLPIQMQGNKCVVVVHIPPSLGKPHLTKYKGEMALHIRGTESTMQMTSHDIRQAVLSSVSAFAEAREYLKRFEQDTKDYAFLGQAVPSFLFQTMPLLEPSRPIENSVAFPCLRSKARQGYVDFPLYSMSAPKPTIEGVYGTDNDKEPTWRVDLHRNGYVGVIIKLVPCTDSRGNRLLYANLYAPLFSSFCRLCDEFVEASNHDAPCIVRCKLLYAAGLRMDGAIKPWPKPEIVWPDIMRQTGESFMPKAGELVKLLYNAFGLATPAT